jgi:hypothetical protein
MKFPQNYTLIRHNIVPLQIIFKCDFRNHAIHAAALHGIDPYLKLEQLLPLGAGLQNGPSYLAAQRWEQC